MIAPERLEQMKKNARSLVEAGDVEEVIERVRDRLREEPNNEQVDVWLTCLTQAVEETND